jgi:hypothetical protein
MVLLFLLVVVTPAAAQEPDLVALVNQARANAGIAPLVSNTLLVNASQRHSNDMAAGDFLSHTGGDGSSVGTRVTQAGYSWNFVGENVLYRWDVNTQGAFDQWWNSTGHRNNMMNASFCDIGVTRAQAASGRIYYTMVLARRSGVSTCPSGGATATPTPTPTRTPIPPTSTPTQTPTATSTPQTTATLNGTITIQGRSAANLPLVVTIGGTSYTPTTNASGVFSIPNLAPGTHSIRVKHAQALAVIQSVTLTVGANAATFSILRMGDVNNDNAVTLADFSLLATSFNRSSGQPGFDGRADLNGDGAVTLQDFSLLAGNFNQVGQ